MIVLIVALLTFFTTIKVASAVPEADATAHLLSPSRPLQRQLSPDQIHSYKWPDTGQASRLGWRLTIEQQGIDVAVHARLLESEDGSLGSASHNKAADGTQLATPAHDSHPQTDSERTAEARWNSPLGRYDHEVLLLPTSTEGFSIRPVHGSGDKGSYILTVEPVLHPQDDKAAAVHLGEQRFSRACRVIDDGTLPTLDLQRRAAEEFEASSEAFRTGRLAKQRGRALLAAAILWRRLGEPQRAEPLYRAALDQWRQLKALGYEALTLEGLGQLARRRGQLDNARRFLGEALQLWHDLERPKEEASSLGNLGLVAQVSGQLEVARGHYQSALKIFEESGQLDEQANLWLNIASVQSRLGEADPAFDGATRSLQLFSQLDDPRGQLDALNNLAVLHRRVGEPERALALYDQVRQLAADLGDTTAEGRALNNLGYTYLVLGEVERAAEYLERALKYRRQVGDRRGEAATLNNLGQVESHRGRLAIARQHLEAALALSMDLGNASELEIRGRLGHLLVRLDDPAAEACFEAAFALAETIDSPYKEAELYFQRGAARLLQGTEESLVGAQHDFSTALSRWQHLGDLTGQIVALTGLGRLHLQTSQLSGAQHDLEEAVRLTETLRHELVHPDLQATFLSFRQDAYSLLLDVLMSQHQGHPGAGYDRRALEISEAMHARSLGDALARARVVPTTSASAELLERRRGFVRRLGLIYRHRRLLHLGRRQDVTAEQLNASRDDLQAQLDLVETELQRQDPRRAVTPNPPRLSLNDMAKLIEDGTLLLHYALGETRSFLFAFDGARLKTYELPPRQTLEISTRSALDELRHLGSASKGRDHLETLSRTLLATLHDDFEHSTRWLVVGDGALHYLPFGALRLPSASSHDAAGGYVIDRVEVVQLPSMHVLDQLRRALPVDPSGPLSMAVLADPVFALDDPRLPVAEVAGLAFDELTQGQSLASQASQLERLTGSGREADIIAQVVAEARSQGLEIYRGFDANREVIDELGQRTAPPAILHLATHGNIDTTQPELSSLVLAQMHPDGRRRSDGFLRLNDLYQLNLPTELVVLSGCRTGLGRELRGEGLQGLVGGFLHAGARRVLASLWSVADGATAEWMRHFYRAYLVHEQPPAAAMRQAQRALASDRRYRDPYYWAPFILIGDP